MEKKKNIRHMTNQIGGSFRRQYLVNHRIIGYTNNDDGKKKQLYNFIIFTKYSNSCNSCISNQMLGPFIIKWNGIRLRGTRTNHIGAVHKNMTYDPVDGDRERAISKRVKRIYMLTHIYIYSANTCCFLL